MPTERFADKPGYQFPGPPPKEALEYFRAKGIKPGFSYQDVWAEEHATAFTVAKAMQLDILTVIRTALDEALANGKTFAQFQRELKPLLEQKGWWGKKEMSDPRHPNDPPKAVQLGSPRRLKTIYNTNLGQARMAGKYQRAQRTKEMLPYLMYEVGASEHHRADHLSWHGIVLPVDDPWWDTHHPKNGWGCHCTTRQLTQRQYDRLKQAGIPDPVALPIYDEQGSLTGRREQRLIPIQTEAPPIRYREWVNKRTGEMREVPEGIDPGFEYNPGKVARDAHMANVFGTKLKTTPANIGAEAMVNATVFVKSGLAKDYRQWIKPLMNREAHAVGEAKLVAVLKPEVLAVLMAEGKSLQTAAITLKDTEVRHLSRPAKQKRDQALAEPDMLDLVEHLDKPLAILRDKRDGQLVYVFRLAGKADQVGKVAVQMQYAEKVRLANTREIIETHSIRTAGKVPMQSLKDEGLYEVLWGVLEAGTRP